MEVETPQPSAAKARSCNEHPVFLEIAVLKLLFKKDKQIFFYALFLLIGNLRLTK